MREPQQPRARLVTKKGIWMLRTGRPVTAEETDRIVDDIRRERELSFLFDLVPSKLGRKPR